MPLPNRQQRSDAATPGDRAARVAATPWTFIHDCLRALALLAWARWTFGRMAMRELEARNAAARGGGRGPAQALPGDAELVERVAATLPRIAQLIPWRTDCLVQALAAQRWLIGRGVATDIRIGVEAGGQIAFSAHAWSQYGERVVTGNEIARYTVLLGEDAESPDAHQAP